MKLQYFRPTFSIIQGKKCTTKLIIWKNHVLSTHLYVYLHVCKLVPPPPGQLWFKGPCLPLPPKKEINKMKMYIRYISVVHPRHWIRNFSSAIYIVPVVLLSVIWNVPRWPIKASLKVGFKTCNFLFFQIFLLLGRQGLDWIVGPGYSLGCSQRLAWQLLFCISGTLPTKRSNWPPWLKKTWLHGQGMQLTSLI